MGDAVPPRLRPTTPLTDLMPRRIFKDPTEEAESDIFDCLVVKGTSCCSDGSDSHYRRRNRRRISPYFFVGSGSSRCLKLPLFCTQVCIRVFLKCRIRERISVDTSPSFTKVLHLLHMAVVRYSSVGVEMLRCIMYFWFCIDDVMFAHNESRGGTSIHCSK